MANKPKPSPAQQGRLQIPNPQQKNTTIGTKATSNVSLQNNPPQL